MSSSVEFPVSRSARLERLRAQLQGRPAVQGRGAPRVRPGRGAHLLLGVMLRGAARLDAGLELSELERHLVDCLGLLLEKDEVRDFGRVFNEEVAAGNARQTLPETVTDRVLSEAYSEAHLREDLALLGGEIRAEANLSVVDVTAPLQDGSFDSAEFLQAMADYGFAVTLATASPQGTGETPGPGQETAAARPPVSARMDFSKFYCVRDTPEATKDEIYWAYGSANEIGTKRKNVTREYGSGVKGKWWTFDSGTTLFDGQVTNALPVHIECWEADDSPGSWYNQLRDALERINAELEKIAFEFRNNPAWHWDGSGSDIQQYVYVIFALISALIEWFRNDDDLVQQRTIVFSRPALSYLSSRPDQTDHWDFNSSEGHFQLYLKVSHYSGCRLLTTSSTDGTTWSPEVQIHAGATDSSPALATYNGRLHCVHRGAGSTKLFWNHSDGTSWTGFEEFVGAGSPSGTALAAHGGKLYGMHHSDKGELFWHVYDGSWGGFAKVTTGSTHTTPALASDGSHLYCMVRGLDSALYWSRLNGSSWSSFTKLSSHTPSAPALAAHGGKLYSAHHGADGSLYWNTFNAGTWSGFQKFPYGATNTSPALASHAGKLYCVHRHAGERDDLFWATLSGEIWSGWYSMGTFSQVTPGLASLGSKLYCVYRD
jgi:hypothetical protein